MDNRKLHSYSNSFYRQNPLTLDGLAIEQETLSLREQAHHHDNIEYWLVQKGTGTLHINGELYKIKKNDLIRLFPFHVHDFIPDSSVQLYKLSFPLSLMLYIDMSKQFQADSLTFLECGSPILSLPEEMSADCSRLFQEIQKELKLQQCFYEFFILSSVMRVVNIYERQAILETNRTDAQHSLLWRVLEYMHVHFSSDAGEVAQAFGITVAHLNYLFRSITGSNFNENRHQVRIRNACSMMQFKELSIAFIANYVGYHSLSTFYRVFQDRKGMTPDEYRRQTPSSEDYRADTAWQILLYLFEHYKEDLKSQGVAEHFFVSSATLADILKRNYDMSFSSLLCAIRLTYARALLTATDYPVYDIAMATGFHSIRTFRRHFLADTGMTPSMYRVTPGI